jgi:hypothetical protein
MSRTPWLSLALVLALAAPAYAGGVLCMIEQMEKEGKIESFTAELRGEGPAGFAKALEYWEILQRQVADISGERVKAVKPTADEIANRQRADHVVEVMKDIVARVAGQRDAHMSRLYWHTDLAEAKAAAAESGKPILSLRMLGKLTDEYSCANSRYFRTALYANKEISDYLRDHYVLHWQSVRPVPRVTIDFGDGRKLERTVTGNSAHFVLDPQGRPLDVLPGLYGPQAFKAWLNRSSDFAARIADVADAQRQAWLASYHGERREAVEQALRNDLSLAAPELLKSGDVVEEVASVQQPTKLTAREASYRAEAKTAAEAPLIAPFTPGEQTLMAQSDDLWRRIAAAHAEQAKLDEASVALVRCESPTPTVTVVRENPEARAAGALAITKGRIEDPILQLVRNFEEAMALDMVKNEYTLHRHVHTWFINGEAPEDIDVLNERVYAELFLTPSSDPWLGLAPDNVYTALTEGGLTEVAKPQTDDIE